LACGWIKLANPQKGKSSHSACISSCSSISAFSFSIASINLIALDTLLNISTLLTTSLETLDCELPHPHPLAVEHTPPPAS
ncbi:MAG TPA: hypothetical protein V6D48_05060, partial [Oculatellaceae cyanobacterium]